MAKIPYRTYLDETKIPTHWYNLRADMKFLPAPMIHPGKMAPAVESDLYPIFPKELCRQEFDDTTRFTEIPEGIREYVIFYGFHSHAVLRVVFFRAPAAYGAAFRASELFG